MTPETFFLIANIPPSLAIIGLVILSIGIKARQQYIRLLGLLLLIYVISHLANLLFFRLGINPNYSGSISNVIEFLILSLIYYHATGKTLKNLRIVVLSIFVMFAVYNFLFLQKLEINSYTLIMMSIIVILYAINYFYWLIQKLPTTQLHRLPMFWLNSAWMIFFSGNLFLFVFTSYLVNVLNNDLLIYWTLHNILKIIESLMIIGALWLDLRNIKSRS